jgi:transposase
VKIVIPSTIRRRTRHEYGRHLHEGRHLVENFFTRLKPFRAIPTRYDKTARDFLAAMYLAASVIWCD